HPFQRHHPRRDAARRRPARALAAGRQARHLHHGDDGDRGDPLQETPGLTMNTRSWLVAILLGTLATQAEAQFKWPDGKTAAIVLTYDDAMSSQLDVAVPQLATAGFKGTFFLSGGMAPDYMRRWREVQRAGHELGNHSLFHPCP